LGSAVHCRECGNRCCASSGRSYHGGS
jgi:hypothetical protein